VLSDLPSPDTPRPDAADPTWRDLAREQGVGPVLSLDDMARPELFATDEELEAFLAHVASARRSDLA
jgi:hypothetical protein